MHLDEFSWIPSFMPIKSNQCDWIRNYITPVVDFPKQGVTFQWYANLLRDPKAFDQVIHIFSKRYRKYCIDVIAGLDARGFIFGAALSYALKIPFVMIRKSGKLPRKVERIEYELEYDRASFEIEIDSIKPHERVLIMDDVLATGGTIKAACDLIEKLDAKIVEIACLIEISACYGRKKIKYPVHSLWVVENK